MHKVAIIDYDMGNLFSIQQACENVGLPAKITCLKSDIFRSSGVILPGVGAFAEAMKTLQERGLVDLIVDYIKLGKPFMGICLGMQLLFSESEEFSKSKGLSIFSGIVTKFPTVNNKGNSYKIPQVGWNMIKRSRYGGNEISWDRTPLEGQKNGEFMYFVHSYYCKPVDEKVILSVSNYAGIKYCSSLSWRNVFACQFHPEKSAKMGLEIYGKWAQIVKSY
ncbi:MAG: imidazole glycerol phosphate synthase subunit HisH [Candidatus Omnitrophica bacterium]|nr:imidazole glycerol phosphate synthase subunit HisH [Candidatus Omnitrophota bacterium]